METSTSYSLYDTYITDLKELQCVPVLEEPAISKGYTRSIHNGTLQYGTHSLHARFINYYSGNMKLLSIEGDGAEELYRNILKCKKRRAVPLALRKLLEYVYFLASPLIGTATLFMIFTFRFWGILYGCFMLMFLRFLYVFSRNHFR